MRRRANTNSSTETSRSGPKFTPVPIYSHVSTYRSSKLELQLYSPSLKVHHEDMSGPIAVFSDHDQITGKITLDSSCSSSGRLKLSIEGSFSYLPPKNLDEPSVIVEPETHAFLSATNTLSISNWEGTSPKSVFRDAFLKRRPSISSINFTPTTSIRCHSFSFSLPNREGEELPSTYSASKDKGSPDYFEVSYRVIADWEPNDSSEISSHLEVPFLLHPDTEFNCVDASATAAESWLEMPLKADRPFPVRCAVTLPTSLKFSRSSSIPYFVVFSTTPRSSEMAKEIAADASVSVSLVRQVSISDQTTILPTPPLTPSSDESESSFPSFPKGPRILRRIAKSQPRLSRARKNSEGTLATTATSVPISSREKPLPQIPAAIRSSFSDMRTIQNDFSVGFPKRPRQLFDKEGHPSLETISALPDGLFKSKISLQSDMLPGIDWAGISVKYFLDVSVLIGHQDLRARIPLRIL